LPTGPTGPASPANTGLGFGLFVFANLLLYVRPMEYLGDIVGQRFYLVAILACLLASFPAVLVLFDPRTFGSRPVLVLVLLMWPVMVLSNVAHGQFETAAEGFVDFGKTLLYFFLLVGLVTTPGRLRSMLFWFPLFLACVAVIAVMQAHGLVQIEQFKLLEESGTRLRATGLLGDPNDLGVVLVVAMVCCVYFIYYPRVGLHSIFWLALLGLFLYTLQLTRSRGAMLALGGALFILLRARIGTFMATLLGILSLPGLLLLTGREVDIQAKESTAASRFGLWSDALEKFTDSRGLGIGYNQLQLPENLGFVAHNSYLHAFSELGFIGGCIFLGIVAWAIWALLALESKKRVILNPELRALHPIMTAALVGYAVGMGSLTLCYVLPTFTVFGLTAAYLHMTATSPPMPRPRLNDRFCLWLALLGVIFLGVLKVALRFLPRG
jgi:O-antigen ligase